MILSIDPGTYNTGIAIIDNSEIKLLDINNKNLPKQIEKLKNENNLEKIIIGNNKQKSMFSSLTSLHPDKVVIVDEYNSTVEGRRLCLRYMMKKYRYLRAIATFFNGDHCDSWAALVLYARESGIPYEELPLRYKIQEVDNI